jgi:hypothetical protein
MCDEGNGIGDAYDAVFVVSPIFAFVVPVERRQVEIVGDEVPTRVAQKVWIHSPLGQSSVKPRTRGATTTFLSKVRVISTAIWLSPGKARLNSSVR